jgi:hypothetical protein
MKKSIITIILILATCFAKAQIVISSNTTWNSNQTITQDVIVNPGIHLQIVNNGATQTVISLSPGVKIILEHLSKLTVNGAKLTAPTGFWYGIEVRGNTSDFQSNTLSTICKIENNATLEYAENAVSTRGLGGVYSGCNGIIKMLNSNFVNNRRSLEMLNYKKWDNYLNNYRNNTSFVDGCHFYYDNNYRGTATVNHVSGTGHITMWYVWGVKIIGNKFENLHTGIFKNLGHGIFSEEAAYKVTARCATNNLPCNSLQRNEFKGFKAGIKADGLYEPVNVMVITENFFTANAIGTEFTNTEGLVHTNNIYEVGNNGVGIIHSDANTPNPPFTSPYEGEYQNIGFAWGSPIEWAASGVMGYNNLYDEGNSYTGINMFGSDIVRIGTSVINSGVNNKKIYRNNYTGLNIDNYCYGLNSHDKKADVEATDGLQYYCNTHNNFDFATWIHTTNIGGIFSGISANPRQGGLLSTGEYFNNPQYYYAWGNKNYIHKGAGYLMYYYKEHISLEPTLNYFPYIVNLFTNISTALNGGSVQLAGGKNPCIITTGAVPAKINTTKGFDDIANGTITDLKVQFETFENNYNALEYNLTQLIANGNNSQIITQIQNAVPAEAWILRTELLSRSPFINQETMEEVINNNALPNSLLLEVLIANPDLLRVTSFYDFLLSNANLPQYMINQLNAVKNNASLKTTMMNELSAIKFEKDDIANKLYYHYLLEDSLSNNLDTAAYWLAKKDNNIPALYNLASFYQGINRNAEALAILNNIPNHEDWKTSFLPDHNAFMSYFNMKEIAKTEGRGLHNFNPTEMALISNLALNTSLTWMKSRMQHLLDAKNNVLHYMSASLSGTEDPANKAISENTSDSKWYKAYPVPANDFVTFEYYIPENFNSASIEILDVLGKKLKIVEIKNGGLQNQNISLAEFKNGMYLYYIISDGIKLHSGKFNVQK